MAVITAEITLENKQLKAKLAETMAEVRKMKANMATEGQGLGATLARGFKGGFGELAGIIGLPLGLGAAVMGLRTMAERFDQIGDTAAALNSSVEGVQRLQYMAAGTVTPFEQMTSGLMRIKRALLEVDDEAKQKALANIGLDARAFLGMDADKSFIQLSRAYQTAQSSGRGFAEVVELIKGASPDLYGAISTNTDALIEMSQKSVISAATMDTFVSNLGKVKMASISATNALVPLGEEVVNFFDDASSLLAGILTNDENLGHIVSDQQSERAEQLRRALMAETAAADQRKKISDAEISRIESLKAARAEEAAQRLAIQERKSAEGVTATEQSVQVQELRAAGRKKDADKLERLQKGQQEFQRLRDAHPEMGDEWALQMAHRKDNAEHSTFNPARIHGFKYQAPGTNALDWLYGHNASRGGQSLRSEMKFPALDSMDRKLGDVVKLLQQM